METFLGSFRQALHQQSMVLTMALVPNDTQQSCTSYGNGVFDLVQLGRYVDLTMLEPYGTSMGTSSSRCPAPYSDPPASPWSRPVASAA
jgi:spore germination protein YaaH